MAHAHIPPGTSDAAAPPRSGRPPDAAKRRAILTAAQQLFLARGYAGTSMDQVADAADVSKRTAYRHFGSKEDLFRAAIAAKCEAMLGAVAHGEGAVADTAAALNAFGRAFLALIFSDDAQRLHQLVVSEQDHKAALGQMFFDAAISPTHERLAGLLEQLGLDGGGDALERAGDMLMLWRGKPVMLAELGLERWDDDQLAAHVTRVTQLCLRAWRD